VVHVEPRHIVPDGMTVRSAEIVAAVAEALKSDLVPMSVALLAETGRQVALRGYLQTRAEIEGRPEREILAEALISGECTPETAQAMGERLAPGYLVLAYAVTDPARVNARQVAAVHRAIDEVPGSLYCGDLSALAALLAPLDARPDLLRTLGVLLACDLDRERTASELGIHRRTLRYRLDRIKTLSGIAPDSLPGIQLLRAALTAQHLQEQAPDEL
jgi:PucR C-terminal helix-turn-helix domain